MCCIVVRRASFTNDDSMETISFSFSRFFFFLKIYTTGYPWNGSIISKNKTEYLNSHVEIVIITELLQLYRWDLLFSNEWHIFLVGHLVHQARNLPDKGKHGGTKENFHRISRWFVLLFHRRRCFLYYIHGERKVCHSCPRKNSFTRMARTMWYVSEWHRWSMKLSNERLFVLGQLLMMHELN